MVNNFKVDLKKLNTLALACLASLCFIHHFCSFQFNLVVKSAIATRTASV